MERLKKPIIVCIKICISCAFFAILFSFVRGHELLDIFSRVEWPYLILALLFSPLMLVISCLKWKVILNSSGNSIPFWQLLRIYLIGYFFSNLLPSSVGGDVVRSYYAGKMIDNQASAAVSIFIERFSGVVCLFILVALAPLCSPQLYANPYVALPAAVGFFFLLATIWIWKADNPLSVPIRMFTWFFSTLSHLFERWKWFRIGKWLRTLETGSLKLFQRLDRLRQAAGKAAEALRNDRKYVLRITGLTILFYVLTWVNVYISFRAFGVQPDFLLICALVPAILFVAQFPVTLLGNLGYFESIFVFYFYLVGIPESESLAMSLLLRLKMLSMGMIGFPVYFFYRIQFKGDFHQELVENLEK